ncbi:MAG: DUF547 domain-containing protein [Hyphomonas sp.]|nr:DUF547 domain-containing protein [Hyphomonas sp.]
MRHIAATLRALLVPLLVGALVPVAIQPAAAQSGAEAPEDPAMAKPAHAAWTRLLKAYVREGADGVTRVDYGALKASTPDRAALDAYIESFENMDLSGVGPAEFAAWANLYNAVTVRYIVEKYPTRSIRTGLFGGPWKSIKVRAGGRTVSLDEIEHQILRPRFQDPLVHYAINCAAWSCPNLQPKAWEAATLQADLEAAARQYVNHARGVTVTDRGLVVSGIYDWFEKDFGGTKDGVVSHLLTYASPPLAAQIRANPRIRKYEYDWSLNDTAKAPAK